MIDLDRTKIYLESSQINPDHVASSLWIVRSSCDRCLTTRSHDRHAYITDHSCAPTAHNDTVQKEWLKPNASDHMGLGHCHHPRAGLFAHLSRALGLACNLRTVPACGPKVQKILFFFSFFLGLFYVNFSLDSELVRGRNWRNFLNT